MYIVVYLDGKEFKWDTFQTLAAATYVSELFKKVIVIKGEIIEGSL